METRPCGQRWSARSLDSTGSCVLTQRWAIWFQCLETSTNSPTSSPTQCLARFVESFSAVHDARMNKLMMSRMTQLTNARIILAGQSKPVCHNMRGIYISSTDGVGSFGDINVMHKSYLNEIKWNHHLYHPSNSTNILITANNKYCQYLLTYLLTHYFL